jgi:16S rRNA (guanine527-N7)-methyltransferase
MYMISEFLSSIYEELKISLNEKQISQFEIYYKTLIEYNQKINLTSITEHSEVYKKHFLDSIMLATAFPFYNQSVLDIGSGAGFPSIPLKIVFPELRITIIDSLQKRINFLQDLTDKLSISVELLHGRAEELNRKEEFDVVTARAVANFRVLSELCIPYVKVSGVFLSMKGPNYKEELEQSKNAISTLGGKLVAVHKYQIYDMNRIIIQVQKIKQTPKKYPRKFSKIKSNPL